MSRPWMPLYVADYLADTGHLSGAEHGAYLLLIMHYWQKGSLPDDDKRLASIARATLEQWSDMRATIAEFFSDGWRHERIDAELQEAQEKYEKRAAAGREGGKAKASGKQSSSNAVAGLNQPQPPSHSSPKKEANASKRATRLTNDWVIPDEWLQEAIDAGMSRSQALSEADRMKNWSIGTKHAVKLDWRAAWRNWFKDKLDKPPPTAPPPAPRNAGERALLKLQAGYDHEPPDTAPERLEAGDGRRQIEGNGDAWPSAGSQGAFGRN